MTKDLETRVHEVELNLATHMAECRERSKRMDDHFERNKADHEHIAVHLDNIEVELTKVNSVASGTAGKMVMLVAGASVVVGLLLELIRYVGQN